MALLIIRRTKLEEMCTLMPKFESFLKSFFQPIREHTEWNVCYSLYQESIVEGIKDRGYAQKFNLEPIDFKMYQQNLLSAFDIIVKVDPTRKQHY